MNRVIAVLSTAATILFSAGLSQADLVSYWPLDETEGEVAIDKIGNNDAAWQNAGLNLAWTPGKIGGPQIFPMTAEVTTTSN